jgi:hypothetical protein
LDLVLKSSKKKISRSLFDAQNWTTSFDAWPWKGNLNHAFSNCFVWMPNWEFFEILLLGNYFAALVVTGVLDR